MTDKMSSTPQPPYPLHESIVDRIDPEYAAYYNKHIINQQPVHLQPLHASRASGILLPGASPVQPVASIKDYSFRRISSDGPDIAVRVFTPLGDPPQDGDGWPVCLYFHGGGWVLGTIDTENVVCSHLCSRAKTVVVTVDYRLAPENPFPAAVNDAWESLIWLCSPETSSHLLHINPSHKLAIGGSSCGANLAAVLCQRLAALKENTPFAPRLQLLSVPVMDNTANPSTSPSWKENEFAPALPAAKMLWFRNHYLPNHAQWRHPEASPLFWIGDWEKLPPAVIVLGELDILRDEGKAYGQMLVDAGVRADVHVLKGQPHPFLAMDGVLKDGARAVSLFCERLREVMYPDDGADAESKTDPEVKKRKGKEVAEVL